MKKVFFLLALLLGLGSKTVMAQNLPPYDTALKKIIYTEVVQVPGASKDLLYDRAIRTLGEMYHYANDKFAEKDKANGKIVFNGYTRVIYKIDNGTNMTDPDLIKYKFTLWFKDGKYKYEITDFIINRGNVPFHIERWRQSIIDKDKKFGKEDRIVEKMNFVVDDISKVLDRLKKSMVSDKVEEKKDW